MVGTASIGEDITERKRAEEERQRLEVQLREVQKFEAIGNLAAGIAHDFNNLMQTVVGCSSHMSAGKSDEDPDQADLHQIQHAAETAGRLAHQLLVYAKGGKLRPRRVMFAEVVERAVNELRHARLADIALDYSSAKNLGEVECDTFQIERVIANLFGNAKDAMPNGGTLTVRAGKATLKSQSLEVNPPLPPGKYVWLRVQDTGCGMDAEVVRRVFEPFFTTKPHGHGLGLSAAWGALKSHGGGISVESELNRGTTFCIWLPRL